MSFLKKYFFILKYKSENRDLYKMIKEEIYFYCINFELEINDVDWDYCVYILGIGVWKIMFIYLSIYLIRGLNVYIFLIKG